MSSPPVEPIDEFELMSCTCRDSFWQFVRHFWHTIPGAGQIVESWHMEYIANELQTAAERVFKALPKSFDTVVNISPGTSKSSIASILFPAWVWTRMPECRLITASHTEDLVLDLALKSRSVINSDLYGTCYPEIEMSKDQDTKSHFRNTLGGERRACTVGGMSPTGFHAHVIIGDDLLDPKKAMSEAEMKTAADFLTDVIKSRKVDKAVAVTFLIMQRLRKGDPTDVMLDGAKKEGAAAVRHICLPAELADNVNPSELRDRYVDGLMDPVRLSRSVLAEYKANPYSYAGQFMQAPAILGGGMFRDFYFNNRVKAAPYNAKRIRYWDRAASTDAEACRTAGVLLAKGADGNYYIEHCKVGRWEPDERNKTMRAIALKDRTRYGPLNAPVVWVEAEGGSSGVDAWKGVARALDGFNVRQDRVSGSKDARAEPWSCQLAAGNVYVVDDGTWDVNEYIQEHLLFRPEPGKRLGRMKDIIDASTGAYNLLSGGKISGGLHVLPLQGKKKGQLRIVICSREELGSLVIDDPALLISIADPPANGLVELPAHGLNKLTESLLLNFADIAPEEYQDRWSDPIQPYDLPPEKLIMRPEHGKKIWSLVLKKRPQMPEIIVVQDNGDRRAVSVAYGICAAIRQDAGIICYAPGDPDRKHDGKAPNGHVFAVIQASRHQVIT